MRVSGARESWANAPSGSHLAEQAGVLLQEARERYLQLPGVHRLQHRGGTVAGLLQVDSCTLVKLSGLQLSNRIREASLQTGATDCVRLLRARTSAHEDGTCRKLGGASCNVEVGAVTRRDEVTSTVGTGGTSYTSLVTWRGHRTQGLRQQRLMHRLPDLAQLLVSGAIDVLKGAPAKGRVCPPYGFRGPAVQTRSR